MSAGCAPLSDSPGTPGTYTGVKGTSLTLVTMRLFSLLCPEQSCMVRQSFPCWSDCYQLTVTCYVLIVPLQAQLYLAQQGGPGEFEGTGLGAPKRGIHPSIRHKMERDRLFFSHQEEGSRHESEEGDYFPDGMGEMVLLIPLLFLIMQVSWRCNSSATYLIFTGELLLCVFDCFADSISEMVPLVKWCFDSLTTFLIMQVSWCCSSAATSLIFQVSWYFVFLTTSLTALVKWCH